MKRLSEKIDIILKLLQILTLTIKINLCRRFNETAPYFFLSEIKTFLASLVCSLNFLRIFHFSTNDLKISKSF